MNRWLKWGAIALLTILLLAAAAALGHWLADQRMDRRIEVPVQAVALRSDAQALARGQYLYASRGCVDCHGADGGGRSFVDDGQGLKLAGPNITTGPDSAVAAYAPVDWVRSIRHGVKPDGRPLRIMPSQDYNRLTDDDLAALVAHVRSLPSRSGGAAVIELPLPVRVLYGFGLIPDAAQKIDHTLAPALPVPEGVTLQHGAYVANMCLGCHGPKLEGGKIDGAPPDWPAAPRLPPGPGSAMASYPDADAMIRMFQTGRRPDGSAVKVMPFESLRAMSDTDLRALHLYLSTPATP